MGLANETDAIQREIMAQTHTDALIIRGPSQYVTERKTYHVGKLELSGPFPGEARVGLD